MRIFIFFEKNFYVETYIDNTFIDDNNFYWLFKKNNLNCDFKIINLSSLMVSYIK